MSNASDVFFSGGGTTPRGPAGTVRLTVAQALVKTGRLAGDKLPIDLAANAASLGVEVIMSTTAGEFAEALKTAKAADHSIVIYVETDPLIGAPDSESWWDVPVSETSTLDSTQQARKTYDEHKATQKLFL